MRPYKKYHPSTQTHCVKSVQIRGPNTGKYGRHNSVFGHFSRSGPSVLLQFKFHKVALIADIEKEFLSIEVKRNRLGYFQVFVGRRSNRDFHKKSQESALELLVGWDI